MSCRETTEGLCSTTRRLKQWFGEKVRAKATPPRVEKHDPNYFQPEEIAAILEALETEPLKWQLITHLMIVTGCRRGEIMGPQWEKVDFENNRVKIDKSLVSTKSKGAYLGNTKTSDIRYLTLPDETMNLLRQHKVEQMRLQIANGDRWQNTGFVFTTDDGSNMNPDSITGWLCDFSRRHNLPHINPHAFRHTAASMMIANGVDLVNAAAELGHATASTTLNIYAHQVARARAEASGIRAGAFAVLRQA